MKQPAIGYGKHYRTDGKGHFRKSNSLSYRKLVLYSYYVGRALCANHAKLIWKWQNEHQNEYT